MVFEKSIAKVLGDRRRTYYTTIDRWSEWIIANTGKVLWHKIIVSTQRVEWQWQCLATKTKYLVVHCLFLCSFQWQRGWFVIIHILLILVTHIVSNSNFRANMSYKHKRYVCEMRLFARILSFGLLLCSLLCLLSWFAMVNTNSVSQLHGLLRSSTWRNVCSC